MRLDSLHIPAYRNLRDFTIKFDDSEPITVLLGRNGSGKSYLIEAIVEIFRELESGGAPPFAYTLRYECRGRHVKVDADPDRATRRLQIKVDDQPISQAAFQREIVALLPTYVFGYCSGWSDRLETQFNRPTRSYYSLVLDGERPRRMLFFCRKEYSQLVLLAFFLSRSPHARGLLEKYLDIKAFDSALFVLKTPWWGGRGAPSKVQVDRGDPRFWYARGAFRGFLDRLWQHALAPIRSPEVVERDVRHRGENTERLYLFIKSENALAGLKEEHEEPKDLFGYLESLFLCDLIDEVRVTVERTDGSMVKFKQMSEGEQQILTVLGLLLFTQDDESLYLLDEPDTHLNPSWTYDFLQLLRDHIRADKGQMLVATHNPLMIGSLYKNQVRLFSKREEKSVAVEPEEDPIGIGVEGLLKSELYGLRSSLAPDILEKLDEHYALLGKTPRTEAEQRRLMTLASELNELAIARTHPNPYFEQFANAMARRTPRPDTTLTPEEIQSQARLSDEILAEILDEEESLGTGTHA